MRLRHALAIAGALATTAALGSIGFAQEKPGASAACPCGGDAAQRKRESLRILLARAPLNPFADVKVGDWWAYQAKFFEPGNPVTRAVAVWRVADQDGDDVQVKETLSPPAGAGGSPMGWLGSSRWFDRQDAPTLLALMPHKVPLSMSGANSVSVIDESLDETTRSVGGEDFACKRVSIIATVEEVPAKLTLWFAKDARNSLVALVCKLNGTDDRKTKLELAGYGSGDKADWGLTPDQLDKERPWPKVGDK